MRADSSQSPRNAGLRRTELQTDIVGVDLFCGAGGLTSGLMESGIPIVAGIDLDHRCKYAYEHNNPGARFIASDVSSIRGSDLEALYPEGSVRLLAGCAPCQPFSKLTNGKGKHKSWNMLDHFGRLIDELSPELVTMENVPEVADRGKDVLKSFFEVLERNGFAIDSKVVDCDEYGVPQRRRRFVLLASRVGAIRIPKGFYSGSVKRKTVKDAIGWLPYLTSGETHWSDPLHCASDLSPLNQKRIEATPLNGGTWRDWPEELRLECHKKDSGRSFGSVYGRMKWDEPGPTMTTLCTGLGNGRFGHPEQDRAISLREAALIQSFPKRYRFAPPGEQVNRSAVSRMIGNAVPPRLAFSLGKALINCLAD